MVVVEEQVVAAIRSVVGSEPAALHEPSFVGNEWLYIKECLDSTFVSSKGRFINQFETELAAYTGAKNVISVVNGTAALHIALKLAGVTAGDEVLIPALTFVATANAVIYCGAQPHFVDCEENTLGIDPNKLRDYLDSHTENRDGKCVNTLTGRVIRVIVPMHTFGHPVDLEGLMAVARDYNLTLIEDSAESLGSFYHGQHTGTFGYMGILSFNGNKTITTGGGGAILTDDRQLAQQARHLTTTAKLPHSWEYRHDQIGYNYRLPNLNAALGCAQLEKLPYFLAAKRELFKSYQQAFLSVDGIRLMVEPPGCQSNYWLQTLLLEYERADQRDTLLQVTNDAGYMTRPAWVVLPELMPFSIFSRSDISNAQSIAERVINIPSSPGLVYSE